MIINMIGGGSGGAALNFKVAPGLTQPGTASENTIWVKTEKIGAWYFSATRPEGLQEWDVWFLSGISSHVEFNALKKNAVQVYPISAKQYVNGVWVDVTAKSYQGGTWVEWIRYLYNAGNEYTNITGGWVASPWRMWSNTVATTPNVSRNADNISVSITNGSNSDGCLRTSNKIDLTDCSKLIMRCSVNSGLDGSIELSVASGASSNIIEKTAYTIGDKNSTTIEVDLNNVTGSYYICASISVYNGSTGTLTIHDIRLE